MGREKDGNRLGTTSFKVNLMGVDGLGAGSNIHETTADEVWQNSYTWDLNLIGIACSSTVDKTTAGSNAKDQLFTLQRSR